MGQKPYGRLRETTMKKAIIAGIIIIAILFLTVFVKQWAYLRKAHSTFENYYAFRGCEKLLKKTDTYGTCVTTSGQTIKIVKYQDKWYLDGDLPWACINNKICMGI
jgi:hypothetical protein